MLNTCERILCLFVYLFGKILWYILKKIRISKYFIIFMEVFQIKKKTETTFVDEFINFCIFITYSFYKIVTF